MAIPFNAGTQLTRPLEIDAPGIAVSNATTFIPVPMTNPPPQHAFPAYVLGYDQNNPPQTVSQQIPPRPLPGQHSHHPYHMLAEDNLHPILFQIEPFPDTIAGVPVPLLANQAGVVEKGRTSQDLRFFSMLPRWIDVNVSGELMELWSRLDPRLTPADILERVHAAPNTTIPRQNSFNMRRNRFRDRISVPCLLSGRWRPTRAEVELIGTMDRQQILLNTAMFVSNFRLLKPILRDGIIGGYVDSGLPLDYFLSGFQQPIGIPSDRQVVTLALRTRLQSLAMAKGLGNLRTNYTQLSLADLPSWWTARSRNNQDPSRGITELDGKTHEKFVDDLLRQHPGTDKIGVQRIRIRTPALAPPAPASRPAAPSLPPVTSQAGQTGGRSLFAGQRSSRAIGADAGEHQRRRSRSPERGPEQQQQPRPQPPQQPQQRSSWDGGFGGTIDNSLAVAELLRPRHIPVLPVGESPLRDDEPAWFGHYYAEVARQGGPDMRTAPRAYMWLGVREKEEVVETVEEEE